MVARYLGAVIVRDLAAVQEELRKYDDERAIWACPSGVSNSAGTLALHVAGNLQHFVGAQLGNTGYVRDRDAEFARRDVPLAELERNLEAASDVVRATLPCLSDADFESDYPVEVGGVRLNTGQFLTHLATHLAFHLGQIDYHRRLVTGKSESAGAQSISKLVD